MPGAVVDVLAQRGIDLVGAFPKPLTDDVVRAADYVITMGCGDVYPICPGKHYLDWELADPKDESPERVRAIVGEVDEHVRGLWETNPALTGTTAPLRRAPFFPGESLP